MPIPPPTAALSEALNGTLQRRGRQKGLPGPEDGDDIEQQRGDVEVAMREFEAAGGLTPHRILLRV
jgi:hypothetical protein